MSEQELKLHVPQAAHAAVEKAVRRGQAKQISLRALYFDTPSRALVHARIALRLRLEGQQWVQTLKMPGEHSLSRVEINQNRPEATLDLSLYAGTPAGDVLKNIKEPLEICYETDVQRLYRETRTSSGTVEIAFDRGWLRAGTLQLPISEVEFELKRGQLAALFDLGRQWQKKFGLILDFRSKAERGDNLAQLAQTLSALEAREVGDQNAKAQQALDIRQQVARFWHPRSAQGIFIDKSSHEREMAQILANVTAECLEQIVRNAAFICEVDTAGICKTSTSEHVHQLRIGIRRLRSAWSFFNGMTALPAAEHRDAIAVFFGQLGNTRDEDVLREVVWPALAQAGQPPLTLPCSLAQDNALDVVRSVAFQHWLLVMLELSIYTPKPNTPEVPTVTLAVIVQDIGTGAFPFPKAAQERPLKTLLSKKLKKWHGHILREGLMFDTLACERQHALRKKCKKLRYALQYCESLLSASRVSLYRKQLAATQDLLGEMNDLFVAASIFAALRETQPQAWFAGGWIAARRHTLSLEATQSFQALAAIKTPWGRQ